MSYAAFTWNQGNGSQQFGCHFRGQKQGGKLWWLMATLKIDGIKLKYFNFVLSSVTGFTVKCCVAPLHKAKTRQFGELLDITRKITWNNKHEIILCIVFSSIYLFILLTIWHHHCDILSHMFVFTVLPFHWNVCLFFLCCPEGFFRLLSAWLHVYFKMCKFAVAVTTSAHASTRCPFLLVGMTS